MTRPSKNKNLMFSYNGQLLRDLRLKRSLTVNKVTKELFKSYDVDISPVLLGWYERNLTKNPSFCTIGALCKFYKISLDDLLVINK